MTERPCLRCHTPLAPDGGQLVYCSYCGAPQIFLSEEMQEQVALEAQRYLDGPVAATPATDEEALTGEGPAARRRNPRHDRDDRHGRWPLAIEYALLSSAIALGLDLGGMFFAPLLFIAWLWFISAPILTVGFYNAKSRTTQLTAGFAARLGLLTGLLAVLGAAIVFTLGMVISRFVLHSGTVDREVAEAVAQISANAKTQYGGAAAPTLHLLGIPEFRVGFLLWMCAVGAGVYLLLSMATAGLAGAVLTRRRPAV